jgi:repressor LexA
MTYTPRQLQVLKLIHEYQVRNGYAPTYAELAKELGVSTITIFEHMEALERKGAIRRRRHEARSVEIVEPDFLREQNTRRGLPLKGLLNAGSPLIPAPGKEEIPLGEVFPWNPNLFALRVRGDALGQQHILDGDLLVLEASESPAPGETVLEVHGDGRANLRAYTTEEWRAKKGLAGKPVARPTGEARIQGVLRGLIRQTRAQAVAASHGL